MKKKAENVSFNDAYLYWMEHGNVPPNCDYTDDDMECRHRMNIIFIAGLSLLCWIALGGSAWLVWRLFSG